KIKFLILILILLAGAATVRFTPMGEYLTKESILSFLDSIRQKAWGPVVFILFYAVACVFALPGSLLTLAGGAVFGTFYGTIYNLCAANLGANAAFMMARYLGRDFIAGLTKGKKLAEFDEKIKASGFKTIFRLRLIPLVPFNGLNFGAGLSSVRFRDYFNGTLLGMVPGCFIYTYFADSLLQGVQGSNRKAFVHLTIAGILLIGISFLPAVFKKRAKHSNGL
ncbi:MAG TPA: TVP38/TMEM64 family protein, partial [bacterium]|nr:TVP38/TMEM64 family protein [bacterium]